MAGYIMVHIVRVSCLIKHLHFAVIPCLQPHSWIDLCLWQTNSFINCYIWSFGNCLPDFVTHRREMETQPANYLYFLLLCCFSTLISCLPISLFWNTQQHSLLINAPEKHNELSDAAAQRLCQHHTNKGLFSNIMWRLFPFSASMTQIVFFQRNVSLLLSFHFLLLTMLYSNIYLFKQR